MSEKPTLPPMPNLDEDVEKRRMGKRAGEMGKGYVDITEHLEDETIGPGERKAGLPANFQDKLDHLNAMTGGEVDYTYQSAIREIEDMAGGEDPGGLRTQFYPGWRDEDFMELLKRHRASLGSGMAAE